MKLTVTRIPWYLSWKGLLGTKKAKAIVLKTRFGIHTFGMRYPIDVLILNKNSIVVRQKEHMFPRSLFFWNPIYSIVLELQEGTIKKMGIHVGMKINLRSP